MRISEMLNEGVEQFLELAPSIESHIDNTDNPHNVTKVTLGIENVTNDKQAKETDFRSHQAAAELDHPDGSVTAAKIAQGAVTTTKIADDAVTSQKLATGAVGGDALKKGCVVRNHLHGDLAREISGKVDKQAGMGLSQNSFTDAEKTKLGAIRVVDTETHELDTANLVLNNTPLLLSKSGYQYTYAETQIMAEDAAELIRVDTHERNGDIVVAYRDINGIYSLNWRKGSGKWFSVKFSENTVCHQYRDGIVYAATLEGNVVTVQGKSYSGLDFEAWEGFTLSQTGDIEVRDIFVTDEAVSVVYLITANAMTKIYVDKFNISDRARQWTYSRMMRDKNIYVPAKGNLDTVYSTRFRMATTDMLGNIYLALVLPSIGGTAICRLDTDGNVNGEYFPISGAQDTNILQDIVVRNNKLYCFGTTRIIAIDLITGAEYRIWKASTGRLRGLSVSHDNMAYLCTERTDGLTQLYVVEAAGQEDSSREDQFTACKQTVDGQYLLARYLGGEMHLYSIEEGTNILKDDVYTVNTVYTIG